MTEPVLLPCRVTLADNTIAAGAFPPAAHTRAFLKAVVAHQEHVAPWLEVPRGARIDGELRVARWPRDNFHHPADHAAILAHVERYANRGHEVFCGIVPKTEPQPRKEAAQAGRVVWVDIDRKSPAPPPTLEEIERLLDPEIGEVATDALVAAARLLAVPACPHLIVLSGSGGAHGYWRIEQTPAAEWIERANVRLIHHLGEGADYASYDRNRFMRVPGTRNFKSGRFCQVVHADLTSRAYDVRDLVGALPDPPPDDPRAPKRIRRRSAPPSPRRARIDDPVDRWTPREYFAALCGVTEYNHAGKAPCPLDDHEDPRPSCWVGDTVDEGWFCLHGDTRVMTWVGPQAIGELAGSIRRILTTGGVWREAPFRSFGRQRLQRIVLSRNGVEKEILATPEHRWFVVGANGRDRGVERTRELTVGGRLWSVSPYHSPATRRMTPSAFAVARGFTFGDGSRLKKGAVANMYGDKDLALLPYFPKPHAFRHKRSGALVVHGLPAYFKELPPLDESPAYLYGWLSGYFAADGHMSRDTVLLASADREHLEFVRVLCDRLGIGTYGISCADRTGFASPGSRTSMHYLRFVASDLNPEFFVLPAHRERFENFNPAYARRRWTVKRVLPAERTDEVFCAQVQDTHAFALEDNILTGNCYGCGRGGRIFDLASLLIGGPWGADLRDDAFRAARAEIERRLGVPIPGR